MKCFFHEALTYRGYTAPHCIIDNTNLARVRGTGSNAVMVPEMEQFGKRYGFRFVCHELTHSRELLELYIPEVIMPKREKLSKADKERESTKRFKELRNRHNAIESDINCLEHHGLNTTVSEYYE